MTSDGYMHFSPTCSHESCQGADDQDELADDETLQRIFESFAQDRSDPMIQPFPADRKALLAVVCTCMLPHWFHCQSYLTSFMMSLTCRCLQDSFQSSLNSAAKALALREDAALHIETMFADIDDNHAVARSEQIREAVHLLRSMSQNSSVRIVRSLPGVVACNIIGMVESDLAATMLRAMDITQAVSVLPMLCVDRVADVINMIYSMNDIDHVSSVLNKIPDVDWVVSVLLECDFAAVSSILNQVDATIGIAFIFDNISNADLAADILREMDPQPAANILVLAEKGMHKLQTNAHGHSDKDQCNRLHVCTILSQMPPIAAAAILRCIDDVALLSGILANLKTERFQPA